MPDRESHHLPESPEVNRQEFQSIDQAVAEIEKQLQTWEASHHQDDDHSVIIIAGGPASGKTTLAEKLSGDQSTILSLDRYYLGKEILTARDGQANFSTPEALDIERLKKDVAAFITAQIGDKITVPKYSMTKSLPDGQEDLEVKKRIIIEGVHALSQLDLKTPWRIYVKADNQQRLDRRLRRDIEQRGRDVESILENWQQRSLPAFAQHVAPQEQLANIIIHNPDQTAA